MKNVIRVLVIAVVMVLAIEPLRSAHTMVLTAAEAVMLENEAAPQFEVKQSRGNAFVRALKAPFKAIGRLFGRGRKDDAKLRRLNEDDVKKFETAQVTRTIDARTPTVALSQSSTDGADSESPVDAEVLARQSFERGREFFNQGQVNEAITALTHALSLDNNLKAAHNLLGLAYEAKGLRDRALQSLEEAVDGKKDEPEYLNNLGYLLYKNGDYDRATRYLKRAVKLAPDDQRFWNNLGLAQVQRGKFDDAYKSFARASGEFAGHLNIATRLQRLGYYKDAIQHLEKARSLQTTLDVLARLAVLYDKTGKPEESMAARKSLITLQAQTYVPAQ